MLVPYIHVYFLKNEINAKHAFTVSVLFICLQTIRGIQYPTGQGTFTYKGFKKIREDALFSAAYGGRATASKIVIVMTDGQSSDKAKSKNMDKSVF